MITDEARGWAEKKFPGFNFTVTARDIAQFAHATEAPTRSISIPRLRGRRVSTMSWLPRFTYVIRMQA